MDGPAIDISSGLVPASQAKTSPPPPQPTGGIDLSSGLIPANSGTSGPAANSDQPSLLQNVADIAGMSGDQGGMAVGAIRGAAQTASGLAHLVRKIPGVNSLIPETQAEKELQQLGEGGDTAAEKTGKFMEGAAEFLMGDEALKGLPIVERMQRVVPALKAMQKSPIIAKAVEAAMRNGVVGGVQGTLKSGGDVGTGLKTGAVAAAISGAGEVAGPLLAKSVARIAPTVEDVGGVETPIPASIRNEKPTPTQAAGQESIRNAAQSTARQNLEEVNESRQVPASARALPQRTGPYEFQLKGTPATETTEGSSVVPAASSEVGKKVIGGAEKPALYNAAGYGEPAGLRVTPSRTQYVTSPAQGVEPETVNIGGGGDLRTQDPNVAISHLDSLHDAIASPEFERMPPEQQQLLLDARTDTQRQLSEYRQQQLQNYPGYGQPNFQQLDIPKEIQKINSYTDAASNLESHAKEVYQHFDDLTNDQFSQIRKANKDAWNAGNYDEVDRTNQQMRELFDSVNGAVSPKEIDGADDAFHNAQTLNAVARAVDGSFSGNASSSARSWEYRGFNGNQMMARLNRVEEKLGRPAMERVVGRDNLDTLYQVARLNMTGVQRAKFGGAISDIAKDVMQRAGGGRHLLATTVGGAVGQMFGHGFAGAAAGESLYAGTQYVMRQITTNPKVAQNLIFAIQSGARPENYVPLISQMIAKKAQQPPQDEGSNEK